MYMQAAVTKAESVRWIWMVTLVYLYLQAAVTKAEAVSDRSVWLVTVVYLCVGCSNKAKEKEQAKFLSMPRVQEYQSFVSSNLHILARSEPSCIHCLLLQPSIPCCLLCLHVCPLLCHSPGSCCAQKDQDLFYLYFSNCARRQILHNTASLMLILDDSCKHTAKQLRNMKAMSKNYHPKYGSVI